MKVTSRATIVIAMAAILPLVSCATLRKAGSGSVAMVKNSTSATVSKLSSVAKMPKMPSLPKMPEMHLANLLPGSRVKVVEVREKDLQDLPTGKELAQAHQRERSGFWIFGGPVDFKEPILPEPGADPDGMLLPPRMP